MVSASTTKTSLLPFLSAVDNTFSRSLDSEISRMLCFKAVARSPISSGNIYGICSGRWLSLSYRCKAVCIFRTGCKTLRFSSIKKPESSNAPANKAIPPSVHKIVRVFAAATEPSMIMTAE